MITCDIRKIMAYLPHRYPFILVDRVLALVPDEQIRALKNVTINEPFFQGHFPDLPVMPGVLIIESMAQTGGILAFESAPEKERGVPVFFTAIDKARFRKPVTPGDQLIMTVTVLKKRSNLVKMAGVAKVEDNIAAEAELMAVFGEAP